MDYNTVEVIKGQLTTWGKCGTFQIVAGRYYFLKTALRILKSCLSSLYCKQNHYSAQDPALAKYCGKY